MNKVILIGNMTRDVELKYAQSGTAIGDIGIAMNRKFKDKEETVFVNVTAFGKTAENTSQFCKKGSKLLIEGRLHLDEWEDKQSGKRRSKLGVTAENIQFLDTRQAQQAPPQRQEKPSYQQDDSDVPF